MSTEEISNDIWAEIRVACAGRGREEQEKIAIGVVIHVLTRFSSDWEAVRGQPCDDEAWLGVVDPMIDRYAHLMADICSECRGVLEEALVSEIRDLSADMIMTANILHMMGVGEEYRLRVDGLMQRAQALSRRLLESRTDLPAPV